MHRLSFMPGVQVDIHIAKQIIRDKKKILSSYNKDVPALVDIRNVKSIDKAARNYLSSEDGKMYINAGAILVGNTKSKIMGNIFITFNKPELPTKLFTNKAGAVKWLHQFI